jgi:hypothetical protein
MSTSKLKLNLIQAILASEDLVLLNEIKNFLNSSPKESTVYQFTEEQTARVNESLEHYKKGNYISEEDAEIDIVKWFEERK